MTSIRVMQIIVFVFANNILCSTHGETTAALILARGGSKGVHLKNLQRVGGVSLLRNAITIAKDAGLDDVTVSTDHPLIALEAYKTNASIFRRSPITATDFAPSIWGAAEFIAFRPDIDVLVLIQATSPFIYPSQVREGLLKLNSPIALDCVFSVTRSYKLRWKYINGYVYPLNFDVDKRPRRQDWEGELLETGSFYITRKHLLQKGYFQNNKMSELIENITIEELEATDVITVDLVPERKGLILKHCEYYVSSRRHGTTVTRRYNEFVQLYDVLAAKYPYRAVCRLPPKRVVVGGGSSRFLRQRRAALQRWLTLAARHPVLAHDADVRAFLCEPRARLDKPKHDEFTLAGTQAELDTKNDVSIEEMEATFVSDQEQLRLMQLGLSRLDTIFERAEQRCAAESDDIRELGAALSALSTPSPTDCPKWATIRKGLASAAQLASLPEDNTELDTDDLVLGIEALTAVRELGGRLRKGLHAERAAAASHTTAPAGVELRRRHRYALKAALHESAVCRAYALRGAERAAAALAARASDHARRAQLWGRLHRAATDTTLL